MSASAPKRARISAPVVAKPEVVDAAAADAAEGVVDAVPEMSIADIEAIQPAWSHQFVDAVAISLQNETDAAALQEWGYQEDAVTVQNVRVEEQLG